MSDVLRYAKRSPRFRRWFGSHTRGMIRRSFHRFNITPAALDSIQAVADHDGPLLVVSTHASWWDPLIALRLADCFVPHRPLAAPIELEQYERFGLLRKLGLFGLNPSHPDALQAMLDHLTTLAQQDPEVLICITPQGEFTDPRCGIRLRPGAAAVANQMRHSRVLAIAIEYTFWLDRRPEIFVHARECDAPAQPSLTSWHRLLSRNLQTVADALADGVKRRDPANFSHLPDDASANKRATISPVYDLWLKWRGIKPNIQHDGQAPSKEQR